MTPLTEPTEGEKDMVTDFLGETILKLRPLIEGRFMNGFDVKFELEGREYRLLLKKTGDPFLPEYCQSKEDGVCNLPIGACQQCLKK